MSEKELCKNCKYFKPYKKLNGFGWEYGKLCIAMAELYDGEYLILGHNENGFCEMFYKSE